MSRRRQRPPREEAEFPPLLAVFDPADWWVDDPDDWSSRAGGEVAWWCARQAFLNGEDWEYHHQPPVWWDLKHND